MTTFGWPEFLFILRAAGWTLLLTAVAFAIGSLGGTERRSRESECHSCPRWSPAVSDVPYGA